MEGKLQLAASSLSPTLPRRHLPQGPLRTGAILRLDTAASRLFLRLRTGPVPCCSGWLR